MAESRKRAALVVVADRRCAEFYTQEQRFSEPKPLFTLQASAVEGAVPAEASDQPGKAFDSHGQGRHKMEPPTTLREDAARVFANAIAGRMEETMTRERLDGLIVVAEPKLLGLLREEIGEQSIARPAGDRQGSRRTERRDAGQRDRGRRRVAPARLTGAVVTGSGGEPW